MSSLKVAVAQISSVKGDVATNMATHLHAIEQAAAHGVSYLVFPELSLTGYEPELAKDLAFTVDDPRLQTLIEMAIKSQIWIGVGAPLNGKRLPKIGLLVFSPDGTVSTYEKMHLHLGEDTFFDRGHRYHTVKLGNSIAANAICADANNQNHAAGCAKSGASMYLAGVLISEHGFEADSKALEHYAKKYGMLVAMANHNAPTGGWIPIGKSTIWTEHGVLAQADERQSALVVAEQTRSGWRGQVIEL